MTLSVSILVLLSATTPAAHDRLPYSTLPIIPPRIASDISIEKAPYSSHDKADADDDDRRNDRDRQCLRRFEDGKSRNEYEDRHNDGDDGLIRLARADGQKDRKHHGEDRRAEPNQVTINHHRRNNSTNFLHDQSSPSGLERRFINVR